LPPPSKNVESLILGLPFASCPDWEMIKAAAVLLAAVVAAEYKTNDHLFAAAHKFPMAVPTPITGSESKCDFN